MMNNVSFKLNVTENKSRFGVLFATISSSCVLPILEDIRMVQNSELLRVMATDLENTASFTMDSQGSDFDFCIDAKKLSPFFTDGIEDVFCVAGTEERVSISSGAFSVSVALDNSEKYPRYKTSSTGVGVKIKTNMLCDLFEKAIRFVSDDDLRPAMTGINLVDYNGSLYIVATDAHRLFYRQLIKTPESMKGVSLVIPRKSTRLFVSMFRNEEVEIKTENDCVFFVGSKKELQSRLIDSKFPDFSRVLPDCQLRFALKRRQLNIFIKIAKHFTDKSTNRVTLSVSKENISFGGGDLDEGSEFNYKLPVYNSNKGFDEFVFSVNIKFLIDALYVNKKDEFVSFEHTGVATNGFIIDGCVLMMPLMVNN